MVGKASDLQLFINSVSESYRILGICLRVSEAFNSSSSPQTFAFVPGLVLGAGGFVVKTVVWVVMMLT